MVFHGPHDVEAHLFGFDDRLDLLSEHGLVVVLLVILDHLLNAEFHEVLARAVGSTGPGRCTGECSLLASPRGSLDAAMDNDAVLAG